jgi:hypothetical protein
MRKGKVVLGYVHPTEVAVSFHESVLGLVMHDFNHDRRIVDGGGRLARYSSANISNARNGIVRHFLDGTKAEWLWFVDADMSFPPDTLDRLLVEADATRAPIVGGLCFGTDEGQLFSTLYDLTMCEDGRPQMVRYNDWPENTMFQVTATGAACLLIHRTVLEALRARHAEPFPWFAESVLGDSPMGEDINFCLRAGAAGFPVFVHTGVEIGHAKAHILTAEMYRKQRAAERVTASD